MSLASLADRLDIEQPQSMLRLTTEHKPQIEDARVAIVDDDASAVILMTRLLERDGFSRVVGMGDGERALAAMIEHPPDVMILDVHMPRIDGFRVLREMHNTEARISTVTGILGVSGDQSAATCRAMLCAGADDFIFRPFDGTEFALRVRKLVEVTRHMQRTISHVNFLQSQLRDETRRPVTAG